MFLLQHNATSKKKIDKKVLNNLYTSLDISINKKYEIKNIRNSVIYIKKAIQFILFDFKKKTIVKKKIYKSLFQRRYTFKR